MKAINNSSKGQLRVQLRWNRRYGQASLVQVYWEAQLGQRPAERDASGTCFEIPSVASTKTNICFLLAPMQLHRNNGSTMDPLLWYSTGVLAIIFHLIDQWLVE